MEIGVRAMVEDVREQKLRHVSSAYLTFVAVDRDGNRQVVPQVVPETDEELRRMREAEIRRSHRLARRAAIIASREEDRT